MAFTGRAALAAEFVSDASMSEDCFAPQAANVRHNTPASRRVGTEHCMESIRDRGVITPAMVRKKDDGRYEMISGHRRKHASERLGLETLRCEVVEVSRDEAIILMVDSNAQRSEILPCDKGRAYTTIYG